MKNKNVLGGILASIAALMGIIGHMLLFMKWYVVGMHTPSAEPGCEILLNYIHPLMADLGILAGVMFAVSAYGFFTKRNWAYSLSVVALVPALLGCLVHQRTLHGCRPAPCLFHPLLAVCGALFPDPETGRQGLLESDPAGTADRHCLHLLLDERRCQHQPDDYHRGADLHPGAEVCIGWRCSAGRWSRSGSS